MTTHKIECPTCSQHITIDLPEQPAVVRGPIRVEQPVEVTVSGSTVVTIVFWVLLTLALFGVIAFFGVLASGGVLSSL